MKFLIVVPDGAGDEKIKELGDRTALEAADIQFIDSLASKGIVGTVKTVPDGIAPGSDAANLSVMGYDPSIFLTGRSPLEAGSIGIDMADDDMAFRANIITLSGEGNYEDLIIKDHSSGDISTEEAALLIESINEAFEREGLKFYTGTSYRHCLIVKGIEADYTLTPPHDVLGKRAGDYLPKDENAMFLREMMKKSYDILKNHSVNLKRIQEGKNLANSLWIWGQGKKPALTSFSSKYGIKGAAISAVDLIKGIAKFSGLESINVEGATGTKHTNYMGKADAAIDAFKRGLDFVYLHLEGPDECSHQGDLEGKLECLKDIDQKIVKPIVEYLEENNEAFRVLIVPDHKTPLAIRTHSSVPVPFVIYDSENTSDVDEKKAFNESSGLSGEYFEKGYQLADYFFKRG